MKLGGNQKNVVWQLSNLLALEAEKFVENWIRQLTIPLLMKSSIRIVPTTGA